MLSKIVGTITNKTSNYYQFYAAGENEFSIPVHIMQYCIYPHEMLDEDGTLKTGQEIQLRKKIRTDGKTYYYPAHDIYPPQQVAKPCATSMADNFGNITKIDFNSPDKFKELVAEFGQRISEFDTETRNEALKIISEQNVAVACPYLRKLLHKPAFPMENETIEYKSSFINPPNPGKDNDPTFQLRKIIRTLVGFANSDKHRGTVFVGIKDDGEICGIENEFQHFANGYNREKFTAMFQNLYKQIASAALMCQTRISWFESEGHICAKIDVDYNGDVVLINGTELYVRKDSSTHLLKGQDMVDFIRNYQKQTIN